MLETTRLGIQVKNLKMQVESMSSRLDFDERRARALEGVVQYRPGAVPPLQPPVSGAPRETARPSAAGAGAGGADAPPPRRGRPAAREAAPRPWTGAERSSDAARRSGVAETRVTARRR